MGQLKATFRDLNTERDKNALPSGTSDVAVNVVIDGTELKGRQGFGLWSNTATNGLSGKTVLNGTVVTFANGYTYVVVKCTDGKLYQVKVDATPGDAFAAIVDKFSNHNTADRGWFYFWADRLYYSDRKGVSKWHPTAGTWKAGIGQGAYPTVTASATGGKEGYYHVYSTMANSVTKEEGLLSLPSGGVATYLSEGNGALTVDGTRWTAMSVNANYEFNEVRIYCTLGNTEFNGLGAGVEVFSSRAYLDFTRLLADFATPPEIGKPDWAQDRRTRCENKGTEPVGSRTGYFNGGRALYLDVYPGGTSAPGQFLYSLPDIPTMLPLGQIHGYSGSYSDTTTFVPRPYEGHGVTGLGGAVTGCGAVGSTFVAFTTTQTYWFLPSQSGALRPVIASEAQGCMSDQGCVTIPGSVHALGNTSWVRATRDGLLNIARYRFTPTLEEIPIAYRTKSVAAHYSHRNEVWMAVVQSGGTKATRILIWDESRGGLMTMFEPANLSTAGIVAMKELSTPDHAPQMLIFLDNGSILNYPDGTYLDGTATAYACEWQGYFSQERRHQHQRLVNVHMHMGTNAGGITLEVGGLRTSGQNLTTTGYSLVSKTITTANDVDVSGVDFDPHMDGNLFRVNISSSEAQTAEWEVSDMVIDVQKVT
ncbi:MAG TPA: hypothetical protein VMY35_04720 [Phycisphaerae bacterium]|nr:hypothetical protein [Phycisphaerae bacterium]